MVRSIGWDMAAAAALGLVLAAGAARGSADDSDDGAVAADVRMEPVPRDAAGLFETGKVWSLELRLTPQAFAGMEPKGSGSMLPLMGAMLGGDGGRRPADLLAAAMVKRGDADRDGRLDRLELDALAGRWFEHWDGTRAGKLDLDTLRAGLKATLDPEGVFESKFPVFLRAPNGKRNGLATALGIEFAYARATLAFEGETLDDVGVRYKGNGTFIESRATPKRSLKLDLNHFVKGRKLAGLTKLNLHSNVTDASAMIESIAYRLYRDAGVPAPRTSYAQVYLTVPPERDHAYVGLYSLVEDVDKDFAKDRFGGGGKGAIFKPVTPNLFADLGESWADFERAYEPKGDVSTWQAGRVMGLSRLMSYATDPELAARVGDFIDLDEFARFMAVTVYLASMDSILQVGQNYFLYLDPNTEKFQFVPWDVDHAFGRIFAEQAELARLSIHTPWAGHNRFLERVFNVPAFKERYLARQREFGGTIFSPERLAAQVDEVAASIRPSVEGESAEKLARFDEAVKDEAAAGRDRRNPAQFVRAFSRARTQSVRDQLAGKAEGVRPKATWPGAGGRENATAGKPQGRTLAAALLEAFDGDRDARVSRTEFAEGFGRWYTSWAKGRSEGLTEEQLREGIRASVAVPAPVEDTAKVRPAGDR
jgi:spore coat protein CotH